MRSRTDIFEDADKNLYIHREITANRLHIELLVDIRDALLEIRSELAKINNNVKPVHSILGK
jgi:hypothetical protein